MQGIARFGGELHKEDWVIWQQEMTENWGGGYSAIDKFVLLGSYQLRMAKCWCDAVLTPPFVLGLVLSHRIHPHTSPYSYT